MPAEDYHQQYLDKNPGGYCHIPLHTFRYLRLWQDLRRLIAEAPDEGWKEMVRGEVGRRISSYFKFPLWLLHCKIKGKSIKGKSPRLLEGLIFF